MILHRLLPALLLGALTGAPLQGQAAPDSSIIRLVRRYHAWAIRNDSLVGKLQPSIRDMPNSNRYTLDRKELERFIAAHTATGLFAPEFPANVRAYYAGWDRKIKATSAEQFAQARRDGRGPILETEDMDIFFCAQEYDLTPQFADAMRITDFRASGDSASAVVVSSYKWKNPFTFRKVNGRWRIAGYCVFGGGAPGR